MQSCSHGYTNLHKAGFWPLKEAFSHYTMQVFSLLKTLMLIEKRVNNAGFQPERESHAKRNHTATAGHGKPHHNLHVAGVKVFTHGPTETVCL